MSNIDNAPRLGPSKNVPRIKNTPRKPRQTKKPSQLAKERQNKEMSDMTLAERLLMANEAMPEGQGMVGKVIKAGLSGAATGATLGEAISKMYQEKAQRGTPPQPKTMSGMAMTDTDLSDTLGMGAKGRDAGPQQKRYTRRRRELEGSDYTQDVST